MNKKTNISENIKLNILLKHISNHISINRWIYRISIQGHIKLFTTQMTESITKGNAYNEPKS